jgi:hypothetical protein
MIARFSSRSSHGARGFALISVLVFILIIATLLSGMGMFAASHHARAHVDSDWTAALSLAEAGANYEFRKLSLNQNDPDQYPGATQTWGGGSFTVWCANRDGTMPWTNRSELLVFSRGTVDGVTRTVKVAVKGYHAPGNYAIYGTDNISTFNGTAVLVNGDIGTNDQLRFTGSPQINGGIYFNGPDAGWVGGMPGGYTEFHDTKRYEWPTVSQVANSQFPGGLVYLATHNDNSRAIPPITGNTINNSVTLTAGNYYITNMNLTGSKAITFDNRLGPVNIWIGPEGGTNVARFRGGSAAVRVNVDPEKAPRIYVATRGGIDLGGNIAMDALVYAVNRDVTGNTFGHVENSGNPTINGQLIGDDVDLNGNITVNFYTHLMRPTTFGYYGFDNLWQEGRVDEEGGWIPGGR